MAMGGVDVDVLANVSRMVCRFVFKGVKMEWRELVMGYSAIGRYYS